MEKSFIKIYKDELPGGLCDDLTDLFKSNHQFVRKHDADYRRCDMLTFPHDQISESKILYDNVKAIIKNSYSKYKNDISPNGGDGTIISANLIESANIICYTPNKDNPEKFNTHADSFNLDSCSRQVSIIIYLSDVDEGGCTVFPYYKLSVKPEKGTILMFPSFFNYTHYAEAPISNQKYIIVSWIHFGDKVGTTKFGCTPL